MANNEEVRTTCMGGRVVDMAAIPNGKVLVSVSSYCDWCGKQSGLMSVPSPDVDQSVEKATKQLRRQAGCPFVKN